MPVDNRQAVLDVLAKRKGKLGKQYEFLREQVTAAADSAFDEVTLNVARKLGITTAAGLAVLGAAGIEPPARAAKKKAAKKVVKKK